MSAQTMDRMGEKAGRPADVQRLRTLAYWLDDRFRVPILGWRVGLDGLIGLVPGIGDAVTTVAALWILKEAHRLGAPRRTLGRMAVNIDVDAVLGAVPLVGDAFDLAHKCNRRNLHLLLDHLEPGVRRRKQGGPFSGDRESG